jgi:hypothetical protein
MLKAAREAQVGLIEGINPQLIWKSFHYIVLVLCNFSLANKNNSSPCKIRFCNLKLGHITIPCTVRFCVRFHARFACKPEGFNSSSDTICYTVSCPHVFRKNQSKNVFASALAANRTQNRTQDGPFFT